MKKDFTLWIKKAGIRAVKTMAQAFIAVVGTSAFMYEVDWKLAISATILSGILSLATSVAGIPEVDMLTDIKEGESDV